jgi:hypothetical protein
LPEDPPLLQAAAISAAAATGNPTASGAEMPLGRAIFVRPKRRVMMISFVYLYYGSWPDRGEVAETSGDAKKLGVGVLPTGCENHADRDPHRSHRADSGPRQRGGIRSVGAVQCL